MKNDRRSCERNLYNCIQKFRTSTKLSAYWLNVQRLKYSKDCAFKYLSFILTFTVLTSVANEKNSFPMREFLEDCSQYLSEANEPKTLREKRQKN